MVRLWVAALLAFSCAPAEAQPGVPDDRPIVVQGAMPSEVEKLVARLDDVTLERVAGWRFWKGRVDGRPVVVSQTLKGVANAGAATMLAVERHRPLAIINQGTAGGHDPSLRLYDIVLGESSVSLSAFKSPHRPAGGGSNPLEWKVFSLMTSEGSAANDPNARKVARFAADPALLDTAKSVRHRYARAKVVPGVIGSSDMWHEELDLIARFRAEFGTSVEDMETAAAAQIAQLAGVPFLGVRVVSDNITNGARYEPRTAEGCQEYVYELVKALVAVRR
jgi:adenosylhomocysteine nucleosidase